MRKNLAFEQRVPPTTLNREDEKALESFCELITKAWEMQALHGTDTEEEDSYGEQL